MFILDADLLAAHYNPLMNKGKALKILLIENKSTLKKEPEHTLRGH